jgi:BlaI family penicillinase repressor
MTRKSRDITDAELAVLQQLWEQGPATIRALTDALYPRGTAAHYATVQKLLDRLQVKGFVRREKSDGANVFAAVLGRDELIGRRLRAVADTLCGGSLTPILTHLVRGERLTPRERQALRELIGELDRKNKAKGARGKTAPE